MRYLILAVLFLCVAHDAAAQNKVPVFVLSTSNDNDSIGQQVTFELKEAIRGSNGFRLIEDQKQWPYMKISMVSAASIVGGRYFGSAAGYAILYDSAATQINGALINTYVSICPLNQAASCARAILADVDAAVDFLRRTNPNLANTLK